MVACKKDDKDPEVKLAGKWNFNKRLYQEIGSPQDIEDFTGEDFYLELKEDMSYSVTVEDENGSGKYIVNDKQISFTILSGDDDITDGETFNIKTLTANQLVLEETGGSNNNQYTNELIFSR